MESIALERIIPAVRPWESEDAKTAMKTVETYDTQDKINFCLEHCPYRECVNCVAGGKKSSGSGRPPLDDEEDLELLKWRLRLKATDAEICEDLCMSREKLRRCKRRIGRERK